MKTDINYLFLSEDYVCKSLKGNIYTCKTFEDAIKKDFVGRVIFIPGGDGVLELLNNTLATAYLNLYDPNEDYLIFLEREGELLFAELNKLTSRAVSKLLNLPENYYIQRGIIPIDEDLVIDNNLVTSRRLFKEDISKILIHYLKTF